MYKKCEKVKRQNDSEKHKFGGVYTSEIWKEPRKPAPILKKKCKKRRKSTSKIKMN